MIVIDKSEKEIIRKMFPKVHIVRTMKQDSKRHHYYCEETKDVLRCLSKIRNSGGAYNGTDNLPRSKRAGKQ